jgi:TatD DNase family protein
MIDSHCHLDFDVFDNQRDKVVAEAREARVHTIVNIGVDIPSSKRSIELADRYDCIYATVGIHPHDAKKVDGRTIDELRELAQHPRVVAIGEIGLDYYRDMSPRNVQQRVFREQLELACEVNLPVVIHTRESFEDSVSIVSDFVDRLPGGVFHCFPGDAEEADRVFDLGLVVSVGGIITFKNSRMSRMAAEVPLEKVLLETDAPYLAPVPFRGKTNQPAYVVHTCRKLAELRGESVQAIEKVTDRNVRKLFGLAETFGG